MTSPAIAAVIPVYNDRKALERAIPVSLQYLAEITPDFELIIAEDGSTDGSAELVRETSRADPHVRLLHSDERLGRGRALNRAFRGDIAPIVLYYDVDLATGMEHLKELVGAIQDGYDIATGSRLLPDSRIRRTGGREFASRGYNFLVRTILRSRLHDHQCGFKSFRRDRVLLLAENSQGATLVLGYRDPGQGPAKGLPDKRVPGTLGTGPGDDSPEERCDRYGALGITVVVAT